MSGTVGGCKSIVTDYCRHKRTMNYGSNVVGYKIGMNSRDGWIVQREEEVTVTKEVSHMTTVEALETGTASGWWEVKQVQLEVMPAFPTSLILYPDTASLPCWFKSVMAKRAFTQQCHAFPLSGDSVSRSWLCSPFLASSTWEFPV